MRLSRVGLLLLCLASVAIITTWRIVIGPADLYEKDQPKTLAYTADMLVHGRWALPRDVIYQPATKPPLYNWIAAGVMRVTGSWGELAMKSPSVIGAFGVGLLLVWAGRTWRAPSVDENAEEDQHGRDASATAWIGVLAAAIWFTFGVGVQHASTIRLMFLARPDMLQAFFLTGAWLAATMAIARPTRSEASPSDARRIKRSTLILAAAFWLCVIGAVLTKGPLALLLIVYVPIAAHLLTGSWRSLRVLWPAVGLIVTALAVGAWVWSAYRIDPDHVRDVMLGAEIIGRVTDQTPEGIRKPVWYAVMWFETKGGPFAILASVAAAMTLAARRWKRPVDPITLGASLWLIVLLLGLSLPAGKRMDYLLPTYAPAAWLAARALIVCCERLRAPIALAGLAPLLMAVVLGHAHLTKFAREEKTGGRYSDLAVAFCRDVMARVKSDESLLVLVRGKHPLPTLLHRHQGSYLTHKDLADAQWVILPTSETAATPLLTSEPLPVGFETVDQRAVERLGLFRAADVPLDVRLHAQIATGQWTTEENPYRAIGTVWRGAEE